MFLANLKAYFGVERPKQYTSFDTPLRFDALLIFSPCILISEILSSPNLVKHGSSMFIHYKGRKYFTCTPKSLHSRPTTKKEKKNLNLVKCKITLTLRKKKKKKVLEIHVLIWFTWIAARCLLVSVTGLSKSQLLQWTSKNRETRTSFIEELLILNAVFRANCRRIDLTAVQGQSSRLSVILRGTQSSRLVQCFSSHPEELQVSSKIWFLIHPSTCYTLPCKWVKWI